MMKFKLSLLLFGLLCLTVACQKYTGEKLPATQIHFGEGGGITGAITEYCLLKNGQLLHKKHFTKAFEAFEKIKKSKAKKLFKTCEKIEWEKMQIDNPGDKYYFIAYETAGLKHKLTWGGAQEKPSMEIIQLYAALKELTVNE